MPDPSKTALTRPKTRGLLASLLKSDSDFDAFCSDYFPHVYQRVLTDLGQRQRTVWLSALSERDLLALDELIKMDFQRGGYLVVDDFHHLNQARQEKLTSLIKVLSDRNRRDAKVTLIGVNPLRASLLAYFPDVFNRFAVVTMARQPEEKVDELIRKGETVANLTFKKRREFVVAAAGSFAIAQRLCLEATLQAGILEARAEPTTLDVGPEGVIRKVHQDPAAKFRALLAAFAAFDRSPPPRGACLLLLWHLSRSENASVSLHDVRYRYAQLTEVFSWLMASNLSRFFDENTGVKRILHYDRNAAVLSAEDPQLEFYLRHLDWSEFASMTGHLLERWDSHEGPVFRREVGEPHILSGEVSPDRVARGHLRRGGRARVTRSCARRDHRLHPAPVRHPFGHACRRDKVV